MMLGLGFRAEGMTKQGFLTSFLVGVAGACWAMSSPALAGPTDLRDPAAVLGVVPHKALYEVKLLSSKSGSQIINIDGKMFFEWKPACDGWITNHRFNLFYEYADSPGMFLNSDFTTFESFDGQSLNFSSRRKRDGELYEELRGNADISKTGKGIAKYSIPEDLKFDLDEGTMFPMGHTLALVKAARGSKKFLTATVFDGSDEEGPVEINAFIGTKMSMNDNEKAVAAFKPVKGESIDSDLLKSQSWDVRMAFFPLADQSATSDYEMNMQFHENGVISKMTIEYSDFTVTQRLVALEKLPSENCAPVKKIKP